MPIPVTVDATIDYVLKGDESEGTPVFLIGAISDPAYKSALARYQRIQRRIAARAMKAMKAAGERNGNGPVAFPPAMTDEEEAALSDDERGAREAQYANAIAAYSEIAGEIEIPDDESSDMAKAVIEICAMGLRGWRGWCHNGREIAYETEPTDFGVRLSAKSLALIDVDDKIELAQAIIDRNSLSEKQRGN